MSDIICSCHDNDVDKWFAWLTKELGREPTEAEYKEHVLAEGKSCRQIVGRSVEFPDGKRRYPLCGGPAVKWVLSILSGPEPVCMMHSQCASYIRPFDHEPGFYENM